MAEKTMCLASILILTSKRLKKSGKKSQEHIEKLSSNTFHPGYSYLRHISIFVLAIHVSLGKAVLT